MEYFAQLNITMASHGASKEQFSKMRVLIIGLTRTSQAKTSQDVARYTIILMNQACGREEAIYKMKTFLRG